MEMSFLKRMIAKAVLRAHRMRRGMTLGVRAIVIDDQNRVLLVKHTYVPGWYLPGGGVEPGETFNDALEKELSEEANITLTGDAEMLAIFQNKRISVRDHVALYHCPSFQQDAPPKVPNREILDAGFFPLDDLPDDVTPATRERLKEFENGGPYPEVW